MSLNKAHQAFNAKAYRLYAASKPTNLVPPRTHVNSTSKGAYTGNNMGSARPEANNQINSLPMGVQIVRVM